MGEEPKPKTVVFSPKLWFWAKNCGFWLKTTVFGPKLQFSVWFSNVGGAKAKNRSFQCGFQIWEEPKPKTAVFGQKLQFPASKTAVFKSETSLVDNCSFQPKTAVFSVVFKCGRSQGQKPLFLTENRGF